MATDLSEQARSILRALTVKRNVLISGAPGTGKSKLLSELALAFEQLQSQSGRGSVPVHDPGARIPIPSAPSPLHDDEFQDILPSADRRNRKVFRTAFHQGSKYRDFVSGLVPVVKTNAEPNAIGFRIVPGTLYRAAQHAQLPDGASLLIIDEINRGPAVQVFGGSIVAIEADKRLAADGSRRVETQFFELLDPSTGETVEYALPYHLYVVAAMNQADASVEPLDVAFLRRWVPFVLEPDPQVLRTYYGRPLASTELPVAPRDAGDVYEAAIQAWEAVNKNIRLGRGADFEIGHGILMDGGQLPAEDLGKALFSVAQSWKAIRAHINEVFFGDTEAIAAILNVASGGSHLYSLLDVMFANRPRLELSGPSSVEPNQIYGLLRAIAK